MLKVNETTREKDVNHNKTALTESLTQIPLNIQPTYGANSYLYNGYYTTNNEHTYYSQQPNTCPPITHTYNNTHTQYPSYATQTFTHSHTNNNNIQYLQRYDGCIISPNADLLSINTSATDETVAFTAGDDALFGNNMVTIINVNWNVNIPFATIRMHISNTIHNVPLMDLNHISNNYSNNKITHSNKKNNSKSNNNNNAYKKNITPNTQETLMKLPHLREHGQYIRSMNVSMGPKDYNSFTNGRTANIQNLNAKGHSTNLKANLDLNTNNKRKSKNKRMSARDKGDLFKTELCQNWLKKGHCMYGKKCRFAHGTNDIRRRWRIENYKTQPCCDPGRADTRLCLFGKRCNYAHPGEPLRRAHHCVYLDEEYQTEIVKDYGNKTPYPFGICI